MQSSKYSGCFFRVADFSIHRNDMIRTFRVDWSGSEPRSWSVGALAFFYVLVFLRALSFARTNRVLGPLQITLAEMLKDVFQFLAFFCLIMFAFGIGLSELFWYYGTTENVKMCSLPENKDRSNTICKTVLFSNLWFSLINLFWGIFGYLDPHELRFAERHGYIKICGLILLAGFYIAVILILINMLIAMMSKSYEVTSENEEKLWRFHRAVSWVRYIRGDFTSPPPMNLIPNIPFCYKKIKQYCGKTEEMIFQESFDGEAAIANDDQSRACPISDHAALNYVTIQTKTLVKRYKLHNLLGRPSIAKFTTTSEL